MLQQTTVVTVGPYYQKFIRRWPSLQALAKGGLDDILRQWAGLGYYRRARLLHECARKVARDFDGRFPDDEALLRRLPGFGPYTAAALTAIAFDKPANVVDGNVERIMARMFAVKTPLPQARPKLRALAATLLPRERHGDYAQALMDLGATVCTPRNPRCGLCPWASACRARDLGIVESLPRRRKPKAKPLRRAIAFVLTDKEKRRVYLRRRPAQGLLGAMMGVPSSAWREGPMPDLAGVVDEAPLKARWRLIPGVVRHVFSHFDLELRVAVASSYRLRGRRWVSVAKLDHEALPSVMRKIVRHALKPERRP